jgi:hypothetical protein
VSELGYSTLTGAGAITAGVSCVSRTCRASFNLRGDTAMLLRQCRASLHCHVAGVVGLASKSCSCQIFCRRHMLFREARQTAGSHSYSLVADMTLAHCPLTKHNMCDMSCHRMDRRNGLRPNDSQSPDLLLGLGAAAPEDRPSSGAGGRTRGS